MSCRTCPFNFFSDEATQVQNYGCLPTHFDIINMKKEYGANWACHNTSQETGLKICNGLIEYNKHYKLGLDIKENQPKIDYNIWGELTTMDNISKAIIK